MEIADHNKPVAENILRIIREKGLKQTFVAKNAGYTPQMLNDMLTGRKIIKVNDAICLSSALGVEVNCLFERIEKKKVNASIVINGDGSVNLKADEVVISLESDKYCHQS